MHDATAPKLTKWPFFIGNALLLGAAWFICFQSASPLKIGELSLTLLAASGASALALAPFVLEYRAASRLAEARSLASAIAKMENLESLLSEVKGATANWQSVQEQAEKTAALARNISEAVNLEVTRFREVIERAADREKMALQLEVEKFRRAETEWLQVLVRLLDHVYALNAGALRSSQPAVIQQVGNFQNACRDVARRVGLTPFTAAELEPFDGQRHQLVDGDSQAPAGARIAETIAAGYTFQGKLLRPALVRLAANGDDGTEGA
jgi:molecular chaperone GrpE (heat shock protein)